MTTAASTVRRKPTEDECLPGGTVIAAAGERDEGNPPLSPFL